MQFHKHNLFVLWTFTTGMLKIIPEEGTNVATHNNHLIFSSVEI